MYELGTTCCYRERFVFPRNYNMEPYHGMRLQNRLIVVRNYITELYCRIILQADVMYFDVDSYYAILLQNSITELSYRIILQN